MVGILEGLLESQMIKNHLKSPKNSKLYWTVFNFKAHKTNVLPRTKGSFFFVHFIEAHFLMENPLHWELRFFLQNTIVQTSLEQRFQECFTIVHEEKWQLLI